MPPFTAPGAPRAAAGGTDYDALSALMSLSTPQAPRAPVGKAKGGENAEEGEDTTECRACGKVAPPQPAAKGDWIACDACERACGGICRYSRPCG